MPTLVLNPDDKLVVDTLMAINQDDKLMVDTSVAINQEPCLGDVGKRAKVKFEVRTGVSHNTILTKQFYEGEVIVDCKAERCTNIYTIRKRFREINKQHKKQFGRRKYRNPKAYRSIKKATHVVKFEDGDVFMVNAEEHPHLVQVLHN